MYIAKYLHWGFELNESFLVLKDFLHLLNKELNHLNREIYKWGSLILGSVKYYIVIMVVNDDIHDEIYFVRYLLLGNIGQCFLELLSPFFLDVEALRLILFWFHITGKHSIQVLLLCLVVKSTLCN